MIGSKLRDRSVLVVTLLVILAAVLIGCGGGGGGGSDSTASSTGSATGGATTASTTSGVAGTAIVFSLQWPASTRQLPAYANCVVLSIQRGSDAPIVKTINRVTKLAYTQQITFGALDPGTYVVHGLGYLDNNAQGPVVAQFDANFIVNANSEVDAPLTFDSTIASVVIDGVPVVMETGVTAELTGYAVDHDGNIIILPAGSLQWSVTQGAELVDLTPVGFLSALAPGDVTVELRDVASNTFSTANITIVGDPLTTGGTATTTATDGSSTTTDTTTDGGTTDAGTTDSTTTGTTDTTGTTGTSDTTGGDTGGATGTTGGSSTGGSGIG